MTNNTFNAPLRIAEIETRPGGGRIGITFCPGKKQNGASGLHDRDLAVDLNTIAQWNAAAVVTLTERFELEELMVPTLGEEVKRRFMEWHHLPISDYSVPDEAFEAEWPENSARLRTLLGTGSRILIHCKGGLGRAGMIAARLLVEMGDAAEVAIARVRAARDPGAIETNAQERWVEAGMKAAAVTVDPSETATHDRALGALVGLAVGDAVGTTLEFTNKPRTAVLHDMLGGGPFRLAAGDWTDDTAMALALADSLLERPDLDPSDLMRRFVDWHKNGTYSCTGTCFDIGIQTRNAIERYQRTGNPLAGSTDPGHSGNGALMRLSPVAIRHWGDRGLLRDVADRQTRTTHGSPETVDASLIFAEMLADAISGQALPAVVASPAAQRIKGSWRDAHRDKIRGSGYVVHSLQAAVWAVARTTNFRSAILLAANLGEDADTTAAITGQLAGAIYGRSAIPHDWLRQLAWRERIETTAARLFAQSADRPASLGAVASAAPPLFVD
jgi:ADP-ribosyl-[dinitrogen reductase] hydrolase